MRNVDEDTITPAVLASLADCADPRLREVLSALVRHLHDFAREVKLTEAEWMAGIEFLTATGQKCDDKRQEFILLSDTLGLSTLNVALNHAKSAQATEATVFGPFHVPGAPRFALGANISGGAPGEPLFVEARVRGPAGEPVAQALVDVWQADVEGLYDVQREHLTTAQCRGVLRTDRSGSAAVSQRDANGLSDPHRRAGGAHANRDRAPPVAACACAFMIAAQGYKTLITHVFRDGDRYLDSDAVFGVRSSLVGDFVRYAAGTAPDGAVLATPFHVLNFDFVLEPVRTGEVNLDWLRHEFAASLCHLRHDRPGTASVRGENRERHRAYIRERDHNGVIAVLGGPTFDSAGVMNGTMLVVEAEDAAAASAFVAADPYARGELFQDVVIREWNWGLGR